VGCSDWEKLLDDNRTKLSNLDLNNVKSAKIEEEP